jgi:alpha-amylase
MKTICPVIFTHQPLLLKKYRFYEIGKSHAYFNEEKNRESIIKLVKRKYDPLLKSLTTIFQENHPEFRLSFSFSGTTLDLLEYAAPQIISELKKLNEHGYIEFLSESYSYSILCKKNQYEFMQQAMSQKNKLMKLFGQVSKTFMNNFQYPLPFLSQELPNMGFKVLIQFENILTNSDEILNTENYVEDIGNLKILYTDKKLLQKFTKKTKSSNSVIDTDAFLDWVIDLPENQEIVCLSIDYNELIELGQQELPIIDFIKDLPKKAKSKGIGFSTPSDLLYSKKPIPIQKEFFEKNYNKAWHEAEMNVFQMEILQILNNLKEKIHQTKNSNIIKTWFYLQDQWLFNALKPNNGNGIDENTAVESYINFRNILQDFSQRVEQTLANKKVFTLDFSQQRDKLNPQKDFQNDSDYFNILY